MKNLTIAILGSLLISCGSGDQTDVIPDEITVSSSGQVVKGNTPCDILEVVHKSYKTVDVDHQVSSMDKPYPYCLFQWDEADYTISMALTIVAGHGSEKELVHSTMGKDKEEVKGVGNKAFYVKKPLNHLSFIYKDNLYHVYLKHNITTQKDKTIALAKEIIKEL